MSSNGMKSIPGYRKTYCLVGIWPAYNFGVLRLSQGAKIYTIMHESPWRTIFGHQWGDFPEWHDYMSWLSAEPFVFWSRFVEYACIHWYVMMIIVLCGMQLIIHAHNYNAVWHGRRLSSNHSKMILKVKGETNQQQITSKQYKAQTVYKILGMCFVRTFFGPKIYILHCSLRKYFNCGLQKCLSHFLPRLSNWEHH